jgi:hypothetical protein
MRIVQRQGCVAMKATKMVETAGAELRGGSKVREMVTGHTMGGGPGGQWRSSGAWTKRVK